MWTFSLSLNNYLSLHFTSAAIQNGFGVNRYHKQAPFYVPQTALQHLKKSGDRIPIHKIAPFQKLFSTEYTCVMYEPSTSNSSFPSKWLFSYIYKNRASNNRKIHPSIIHRQSIFTLYNTTSMSSCTDLQRLCDFFLGIFFLHCIDY